MDNLLPLHYPAAAALTWDARLPLDIALNESSVTKCPLYSDDDLLDRYGLSQDAYDAIRKLPAFRAQVREAIQELHQNGLTVKRKASAQFEFYLDTTVPALMAHGGVDPKIKLDIIKFLGQVAGKDGKTEGEQTLASMAALAHTAIPTLNIVLQTAPNTEPTLRVVSQEP